MTDIKVGIKLSADGKAAIVSLDQVEAKLANLKRTTDATATATDRGRQSLGAYASASRLAAQAASALAVALTSRQVYDVIARFDTLNASLKTVTGSATQAAAAVAMIKQFSTQTPYQVQEVTDAFIRLRSLGLDATSKSLQSFGNTASAMGKPLMQFIEAVADASTNEFERLKEFGIKAQQQGDTVTFTFQGVSTTVRKTSADIQSYLLELGNTKFAGGMADQMNTVGGAASNLGDAFSNLIDAIGNLGVREALKKGFAGATEFINDFKTQLDSIVGDTSQNLADALTRRIAEQKSVVAKLKGGALGSGLFVDTDDINQRMREIESMEGALARLKQQMAQEAQAIGEVGAQAITQATFKGLSAAQSAIAQKVKETAEAIKVDPAWALAIAEQESGFNQVAKSAAGAQGVMQLMPGTAKQLGVNIADVNDNIKGGVLYLKQQQEAFKSLKLASAAYNAGPGNVQKFGGVPPFKETQNYVQAVGALYQKWQQILGESGDTFVSVKEQADELKGAYERLKTHQDGLVSSAENYAKVQVEKIKTSLAALEAERKATQDAATAQLAAAKTYDDKQRVLAGIAQQQDDYARRAATLAQQEASAQQAAIAARKRALETELANADRYNLTVIEQARLKQGIAAADADLAVLAQRRAQAEIEAGQAVSEAARQSAALRQAEQGAIDDVIARYEREVEVLNRLTQAKQAGASTEQLGLLNQYYSQPGTLPEIVSAEQLQRLQQYQLSTLAVRDAIKSLTQATNDQGKAEQSVREEQLRQNAFWDQYIGRIKEYAQTWAEITGNMDDPFSAMMVNVHNFAKQLDQIGKYWEQNGAAWGDMAPMMEGLDAAQASLNMMARTMLAMRNNFEEGTQGYKDMTSAAERMMEVQRALSTIEAVLGVIHQFTSGDVYTAIPRAIGVAAMMASLGYQTGLGGGGSATAAYQAQPGQTGTVFGDGSAQSESIRKSLEIIRDNSSNDLNYSAAMLRALENIESAMAGATNSIIRGVGPSVPVGTKLGSIANAGQLDIGGLDFAAQMIGKFVFNVQREISDFGIHVLPHTIKKMFENGFQAASYTDVTTTTKVLGISVSESTHSYFKQLDAEVNKQFTGVITNIAKATKAAGAALGLSGDFMTERLNKFVIDVGRISLANLKGEELQKKLEEMFSTMSDQIAKAVVPGLGKFRQVGEGYFETMIRVAEGTQRATGELAQLGIEAIKFREITDKQKPVDQELFKQSYLASGRASEGLSQFIDRINGTAREIREAVEKFVRAEELLKTANLSISALLENPKGQSTLIDRVGGLDNLVGLLDDFNSNFLTEAQRTAGSLATLSNAFADLGVAMPSSKDAFYQLVQSLDLTTESGQKLFGGLLKLEGAFAKVADEVDRIKQKYADRIDPMAAIRKTLEEVTDDFTALIAKANSDLREKLIKNGDAGLQTLLGNQSLANKNLDIANTDLQSARDRDDEVRKEIANLNAKGAKITKAERKRLSQLTAEAIYLDRQIPILESRQSAAQAALKAAAKAIDDYINSVADQNRTDVLKNAATIMSETLADIMQGLAQTIQEAQQRLDNVLSFQNGLATQIAQLQGSQATADLANARYGQANTAVNDYIGAVTSGGRARDTDEELRLLGNLQTAVMDRYNAEMTLIQEGIQAQTDALNAALQLEIDGINAATQARVEAVNAALEAELDAINAAGAAQIKAQQKADQEAIKAIQKQNDLAVKAAQKANDAVIKAQQKVYDAQVKALQKQQEAEVKALQKQQEAEAQVWQDQLDAANTLRDAIKSIQEYAQSLLLGPNSVASPEQRLAEAQRQYQELAAKARGGDADALAKLPGSSDAYLEAAKQYYGSGSQYQSIFDGVKTAMEGLGAMSAPDPDSIQSHIDRLRESQEAQLDALRESQSEAVDALREQQGEQLDALRETLNEQIDLMREQQAEALDVVREQQAATIDAMREATQAQIEAARKAAQDQVDAIQKDGEAQIKAAQERTAQAIADLSDPNKNKAMKALKAETLQKLQEIHDLSEKTRAEAERKAEEARRLAAQQAADAIQIAKDQLARLDSGLTFSAAQIRALNGLMAGLNINYQEPVPTTLAGGSGLEGVAGYAGGGYAQAGMALVGEKGPELVRFERPAQVLTAEQTRKALSGDDGKTYQALEAIKGELRAIVTTQSGANPQIIGRLASIEGRLNAMEREQKLANSHGGRRAPA